MKVAAKLAAAVLLAALNASAQTMVEAQATGQPLTYTKSGAVDGCGIRIVGVVEPVPGQQRFKSFDVSANVWKSGAAMVKIIGEETPVTARDLTASRRVRLHDGWLRPEDGAPLSALGKV